MKKISLQRKCHKCSELLSLRDEYYTICKEPSIKDKTHYGEKVKVLFFHSLCFEIIAGKEYT